FSVPAAIETIALELLHLLELLFQLVERLRKIVPLRPPLLRGAQPFEEVLQTLHATRNAPAREPRHRILEIAARQELVGHGAQQLLGLERIEALRPVPARVADVAQGLREPGRIVARNAARSESNSTSENVRLKTFSTARCTSRSMTRSSETSPTDSSSIFPAVDATTAGRSLIRGTTLVSPVRSARLRAADTRFS